MRGNISAIVLCGGRSSRMGRDKASLPFGAETLLERTVRVLESVADEIVLVARKEQDIATRHTLVRDPVEGLGPLAGIAAGLDAIGSDRAFVAACDMPFLQSALVERIVSLSSGYEAAVPVVDDTAMTTCAVYSRALRGRAETLVAAGCLRLSDLIRVAATHLIPAASLVDVDPSLESFRNCNTPEEYRTALRDAGLEAP